MYSSRQSLAMLDDDFNIHRYRISPKGDSAVLKVCNRGNSFQCPRPAPNKEAAMPHKGLTYQKKDMFS